MCISPEDDELLELVQRQTFGYFWDFAHPVCAMARDRGFSDGSEGSDLISTGGTGFAIMSMIVAAERGWIRRADAVERIMTIFGFLKDAESYNGVYPHYLDGNTGAEFTFWPDNAGADLVETSYLVAGLLCARQYFSAGTPAEAELRRHADRLWRDVNWSWHTKGSSILFWHWSPTHERGAYQEIAGWNEALLTYVLAASSPTHPISPSVYHEGWTSGAQFRNHATYFDIPLPLGPEFGGPLFFAHYSFLGLDPRGLRDRYANYWQQNVSHSRINYAYCVANPKGFAGYGPNCWGLSSSESEEGYNAFSPTNDHGVIAPTAALGSLPYTPKESMAALKHFYFDLKERLWGRFGFTDAFNKTVDWYSNENLAINQGPIIIMIENFRTGLLWRLFMSCPEVREGLHRLGFETGARSA